MSVAHVTAWLTLAAGYLVTIVNAMALALITIGTLQAFVKCLRAMFGPSDTGIELRGVYIRYARWLIAGLTFQLAADIIGSAGAASWIDIGRLAAIALIRTFLNYFLERDVSKAREIQHAGSEAEQAGSP
jgi:uncharacterized membrane protein